MSIISFLIKNNSINTKLFKVKNQTKYHKELYKFKNFQKKIKKFENVFHNNPNTNRIVPRKKVFFLSKDFMVAKKQSTKLRYFRINKIKIFKRIRLLNQVLLKIIEKRSNIKMIREIVLFFTKLNLLNGLKNIQKWFISSSIYLIKNLFTNLKTFTSIFLMIFFNSSFRFFIQIFFNLHYQIPSFFYFSSKGLFLCSTKKYQIAKYILPLLPRFFSLAYLFPFRVLRSILGAELTNKESGRMQKRFRGQRKKLILNSSKIEYLNPTQDSRNFIYTYKNCRLGVVNYKSKLNKMKNFLKWSQNSSKNSYLAYFKNKKILRGYLFTLITKMI